MATAAKQLEAISQEITERFSEDDHISVTPLDGEPPEKYEITYHIIGLYKSDSGEILKKDSHTITISIPFGFPHFPPSCKPKSDLFHPDFDPAAICIGEFWAKDRSISDLIFYIGTMISGNAFSTSNAFNEEAATWYKANSEQLPTDDTDFAKEIGARPASKGLALESSEEIPDAPGPTDTSPAVPEAPEAPERTDAEPEIDDAADVGEVDPDKFKLLAKQHRFFELDSELADLADGQSFDDHDNLSRQTASALQQAREKYDQATDFEHQGNPGRALDAFKQVEAVVSDYPGLLEDIERTTQAKELLGDWSQAPETVEEEVDTPTEEEKVKEREAPAKGAKRGKRKTGATKLFEDTASKTSRMLPYVSGIILVLVLVSAGGYYYLNSLKLDKARAEFSECQTILKQNRFSDAERQCTTAIDTAKQIQYFKAKGRDGLIAEIKTLLNSEALQQGLAGNRLLDGQYLPKKMVRTILAFKHFTKEGDKQFASENWQKAASNYAEALKLAEQKEGVAQELVFEVTENLKIAQFNILLRSGTEFVKRGKWVLATNDLEQALEQVKNLGIEDKAATIDAISVQLSDIALATTKQQADSAFADEKYDEAVKYYKRALDVIRKTTQPDSPELKNLKELVVKAELYQAIKSGRDGFSDGDWDLAISSYELSMRILESNRDVLSQANTVENRKKLARIILQTAIIRDKQDAAIALKQHRFLTAIEKLQSILDTISESPFSSEIEFTAVTKETKQAIKQAETEMLLADKIAYLENNFKELFTEHYKGSPAESLTEPKVIYEKRLGDKLLFRLECIEVGRGRPLRLVMRYIHDLKSGTWNFYSGKD